MSTSQETPSDGLRTKLARLLVAAAVVCAIGVVVSGVISSVHANIERLGSAYTSFCNVNSSINCDAVLGSPFAKLAGVPIAWIAIGVYAVLGALFYAAARAGDAGRRRLLQAAAAGVIGSVVFSGYLLTISVAVLGTICLLCTALYAVVTVLAVLTVMALRAHQGLRPQQPAPLSLANAAVIALGAVGFVGGAAAATWPSGAATGRELGTVEEIRAGESAFYEWYTSLPTVDPARPLSGVPTSSKGAPVTIVEFSDFECGHCRRNHELLTGLLERRADEVRVINRNFPLDVACNEALNHSIHRNACRAAEAAECAGEQGKRHEMATLLFANQSQLFESNLFRFAEQMGLDEPVFRKCMDSHATLARIREDCRAGAALQIKSTPTLFINGRRVTGTFERPVLYDYAVRIETAPASGHPHGG